jgi:hypothetical protein
MWELNILEQSVRNWRCMPPKIFLIASYDKNKKNKFLVKTIYIALCSGSIRYNQAMFITIRVRRLHQTSWSPAKPHVNFFGSIHMHGKVKCAQLKALLLPTPIQSNPIQSNPG